MQTILITGGTGLIGSVLSKLLQQQGYRLNMLTRHPDEHTSTEQCRYLAWDIRKQYIDPEALRHADAIIHLAGAGVADKRWTDKRKKEIVESRVKSGDLLVQSLQTMEHQVTRLVSASAIGWYGEDKKGQTPFTEEQPASTDFLGTACKLWEASLDPVETLGIRLVKLRTGIVLSNEGGAFAEFKKPVKFGLATILGSGKQVISWIHIRDMSRLYLYALEQDKLRGPYNAVAPHPVTNKAMVTKMAGKLKGKFYLPVHVPAFALKLAMGEMSTEVLKSATVGCQKIRETGFSFQYPALNTALDQLLNTAAKD